MGSSRLVPTPLSLLPTVALLPFSFLLLLDRLGRFLADEPSGFESGSGSLHDTDTSGAGFPAFGSHAVFILVSPFFAISFFQAAAGSRRVGFGVDRIR